MTSQSRVASPRVVNIADLRRLAQARLPRVVFDYLDGGAEGEVTLRDNERIYNEYIFRPRQAIHVPEPNLSATIMGQKIAVPMILSPIGYSRLMHSEGERAAARAAGRAGCGYAMSTISGYSIETISEAGSGPLFLQIYLLGGREAGEATIARAAAAGYKGLFLTIDTPVAGMRERDFRNGMKELMGKALARKLKFLPNIMAHPEWLIGYLLNPKMDTLPNVVRPDGSQFPLTDVGKALETSVVTWDDLRWIRSQWKGAIAIKGVLTAEDAKRSLCEGANAVVVSNHGGRQLDTVPTGLEALPEVVAAVGDQIEVLMDGGIRRGADIIKAIILGARGVLVGRAYAYGMAAAGEVGIDRVLDILRVDLIRTMKLLGCKSLSELTPSYLQKR